MKYANVKYNDIANGEGIRTSIFVSGCTHHCKGCFNKIAWDFNYGKEFTDDTIDEILKSCEPDYVSGLTLLGGEPLEPQNQEALLPLVKRFKEIYPNKTIWCYTGYTLETDIMSGKAHVDVTDELLSFTDIVVDGEFVEELRDLSLKFKGSSNQRIIVL